MRSEATYRSVLCSQRGLGRCWFESGNLDSDRYCALCVMVIAVPVIVNVAVRAGPVLAATVNWTMPSPEPDAP